MRAPDLSFLSIVTLVVTMFLSSCGEKKVTFEGDPNEKNSEGQTLLMQAAQARDVAQIDLLLKHRAELETVDSAGDTALTYAVNQGHLPCIVSLLEAGANPAIKVSSGGSLMVKALRQKHLAAAYLLLQQGARVNDRGAKGETLMQAAVETGSVNFIKDIQSLGVKPEYDDADGYGLLHVALEQGRKEALDCLLEQGLDPNRENSKGESILHSLVRTRDTPRILALKKYGADFDVPNQENWLPVHMAILGRDDKVLASLIQAGARVDLPSQHGADSLSPLELALDQHDLGLARQLLEQKAPMRDEFYQAVKLGGEQGLAIVNLLLEFDASLMADRAEDSPLSCAVKAGDREIVQRLLEVNAPQDRLDFTGQKPFHLAVVREDLPMVKLLLHYGADANEAYQEGPTEAFLKHVVSEGVIKWAMKKSKEVKPLMVAADSGNADLAELLMEYGASAGKSAKVGRHRFWPLSFAARRQDTTLQQVLFKRGQERTKRWIKVDLSEQKTWVYEGDKVIYTTRISSGKKEHRTPTGKYVISNKYRMWHSTIYDSAEMPYFQRLSGGDFGFHYGILPGYPASHGCIRVPMSAAKKLFALTRGGDYVEIVK